MTIATITPKMLGQAPIALTTSTIYTVPASTKTILKEINIANRGPITTPASAAALAASTTGGTIATSTAYVKFTYVDASGNETAASPEANVAVTGPTGSVTVTANSGVLPFGAVGIKVYASSSTGTQKLAGQSAAGSAVYTLTSIPGAGASPPTSNATGSTSPVTVWLFAVPSGGTASLDNVFLKWSLGDSDLFVNAYSTILTAGMTIQAFASARGCVVTASGVEIA